MADDSVRTALCTALAQAEAQLALTRDNLTTVQADAERLEQQATEQQATVDGLRTALAQNDDAVI